VRRYGFHGLSCQSILHQLGDAVPERLIIAHLGSGASVTAVHDGRSVDTSMGLTPSGGTVMATRTGDIDPGLLLFLLRDGGLDGAGLEELIDRQSGLLGISGLSPDMRRLHAAAETDDDAALAIAIFCRSVARQIAGMMTALGGADLIVFTGGIGEHDPVVRTAICRDLAWAGVAPDEGAAGAVAVRVMPSDEGGQIAREVFAVLRRRAA
jgi:acetate kinase